MSSTRTVAPGSQLAQGVTTRQSPLAALRRLNVRGSLLLGLILLVLILALSLIHI